MNTNRMYCTATAASVVDPSLHLVGATGPVDFGAQVCVEVKDLSRLRTAGYATAIAATHPSGPHAWSPPD